MFFDGAELRCGITLVPIFAATSRGRRSMRKIRRVAAILLACAALVFTTGLSAPTARSQQAPMQGPANPAPLYVATFIDLMPPNIVPGTAAIKQYVMDTRKDAGNKSCEAIAQVAGRANHLIVIEVWQDRAAYQKHVSAAHTRDYRSKMLPLIGAPFDEREHFLLQ